MKYSGKNPRRLERSQLLQFCIVHAGAGAGIVTMGSWEDYNIATDPDRQLMRSQRIAGRKQ
jgi:hypothetical protein